MQCIHFLFTSKSKWKLLQRYVVPKHWSWNYINQHILYNCKPYTSPKPNAGMESVKYCSFTLVWCWMCRYVSQCCPGIISMFKLNHWLLTDVIQKNAKAKTHIEKCKRSYLLPDMSSWIAVYHQGKIALYVTRNIFVKI